MNTKRLIRDLHYWASVFIALPLAVMIGAGLFLMLKKEFGWIQPPSQRGAGLEITGDGAFEAKPLSELFAAAQAARPESFTTWDALARADIKPGRDIIKFVAEDNWEAQVDLATGEVLQLAYRRSDLIEALHDGSRFASWTKLWLFFPAGIVLAGMWGTGLYLFALPYWKRWQKRRAKG